MDGHPNPSDQPAPTSTASPEVVARLESNLRLIPWHLAATHGYGWLPVFVLFTRGRFGVGGALGLAGLYYLMVVALEVPSGWFSDRIGRVTTLRVAAVGFIGAQVCYLVGESFAMIAVGQFLLAIGFASLSGTDVSFHYDTLEGLGQADQYAGQRSRFAAVGLLASALSALAGGLVGLVDLRLAFALSLGLAVIQLALTLKLHEPPSTQRGDPLPRQVLNCGRYLRHPYMMWLFFYGTALITLEHLPFTLVQPWLTEVVGATADSVQSTPAYSGAVLAATSVVGAIAVRYITTSVEKLGPVATLVILGAIPGVVVTAMALSTHWLILILVGLRSIAGAAAPIVVSAEVAPRTQRHHRATLLSMNSLAGRLGYGLLLVILWGSTSGNSSGDYSEVESTLEWFSVVAWVLVGALTVTGLASRRLGWLQQSRSHEADAGIGG